MYEEILVNIYVYFIFIKTIFIALNIIKMYIDAPVILWLLYHISEASE